jgi:hypothetical protein
MGDTHGIEDRSERTEFVQSSAISFQVVAMQHDGHVCQFVLVPRHCPRNGLAEFGEHNISRTQARPDWGIEFAAA